MTFLESLLTKVCVQEASQLLSASPVARLQKIQVWNNSEGIHRGLLKRYG